MPSPTSEQPLNVLVVDDCPDMTQSVALLLERWGHRPRVASGGAEALRLLTGYRPDVVLLDLEMPGLSGYEVARQLRALPGLEQILLVAVTGHGQPQDRHRSWDAGCDLHLLKPVEPEELHELLACRQHVRLSPMAPDALARVLTDLGAAADVVEAIDDRRRQHERGWDLTGWRYDLIPWGVRFLYRQPHRPAPVEVRAVLPLPGASR